MRKALSIIILIISLCVIHGFSLFRINKNVSLFTGSWSWIENVDSIQYFGILVGERNDSLLIAIGGIFHCGNIMHDYDFDNNGNLIATVKTPIPKGNKVVSKISEFCSDFYCDSEKKEKFNPVFFELLNDTTMIFILNDDKAYWPDTAILIRRNYENNKFSIEENHHLYKE